MENKRITIDEMLIGVSKVAVFGHVRPDGDCVGSTMGLYNYICDNYPDIQADIYLEPFSESFKFIKNIDKVKKQYIDGVYDAVFVLDASSRDRVGANGLAAVEKAKKSYNLDHHVSNPG